jgi:hypothetical protein
LQDLPQFTQIGIFGFENMPSGNPASEYLKIEAKSGRQFNFRFCKRTNQQRGRKALFKLNFRTCFCPELGAFEILSPNFYFEDLQPFIGGWLTSRTNFVLSQLSVARLSL